MTYGTPPASGFVSPHPTRLEAPYLSPRDNTSLNKRRFIGCLFWRYRVWFAGANTHLIGWNLKNAAMWLARNPVLWLGDKVSGHPTGAILFTRKITRHNTTICNEILKKIFYTTLQRINIYPKLYSWTQRITTHASIKRYIYVFFE